MQLKGEAGAASETNRYHSTTRLNTIRTGAARAGWRVRLEDELTIAADG